MIMSWGEDLVTLLTRKPQEDGKLELPRQWGLHKTTCFLDFIFRATIFKCRLKLCIRLFCFMFVCVCAYV